MTAPRDPARRRRRASKPRTRAAATGADGTNEASPDASDALVIPLHADQSGDRTRWRLDRGGEAGSRPGADAPQQPGPPPRSPSPSPPPCAVGSPRRGRRWSRPRPSRRPGSRRWSSCSPSSAAGCPATTRSTTSASTPTSPTTCCCPRCGRSTSAGSGSRRSACSTCRHRWRPGGGQPLGHGAAGLPDARGGPARRSSRAAAPAHARRRPGVPDAGGRRARPQAGQHAGLQPGRGAAAGRRRTGRGVAGGLQGHREAVPRSVQAAALRARRLRLGRAAHRGADHPVLDRRVPRRRIPRSATSSRWLGCWAPPTSR